MLCDVETQENGILLLTTSGKGQNLVGDDDPYLSSSKQNFTVKLHHEQSMHIMHVPKINKIAINRA